MRTWVTVAACGQQVASESNLRGLYDYETAWKWALSLSTDQRASRFTAIVNANRR